jgi:hypothetical protein
MSSHGRSPEEYFEKEMESIKLNWRPSRNQVEDVCRDFKSIDEASEIVGDEFEESKIEI